jgi:hypothetical protein
MSSVTPRGIARDETVGGLGHNDEVRQHRIDGLCHPELVECCVWTVETVFKGKGQWLSGQGTLCQGLAIGVRRWMGRLAKPSQ